MAKGRRRATRPGSALRPVDAAALRRDVVAGLVLTSINVPQLLGYARIAGMPVGASLATALLPSFAFALLGSSRHLVVSADSATAAIFASALVGMAVPGSPRWVALAGTIALVTAVLLLAARLLRLGFVADFLSRTALVGFLAGIGIRISIAMLEDMLGIDGAPALGSIGRLAEVARGLPRVHPPTLAISAIVAAATLAGRSLAPRLPVALVAVVGGIAASRGLDLAARGVRLIGPVRGGLPAPALPSLDPPDLLAALPVALSCAMVIVAQSAAAARVFALRHREPLDTDEDLLGLAAANAAAAVSGAFVVNGGASQTAIAEAAGGRTQWTQLTMVAVVALVLAFLSGPLADLPHAVLAALVFAIGIGMVNLPALRDIRRESGGEFGLALATALVVGLVGVEEGVLLAAAVSLLRHVRHSYRPYTAVLVPLGEGLVPEAARPGLETAPGTIAYRFGADLFYANDGHFAAEVRDLVAGAPHPVRRVVVDASAITNLDWSAARTVRELVEDLRGRDIEVAFGRVGPSLRADMDRHGIVALLGSDRVWRTLHEAMTSAGAAGARPDAAGAPVAGGQTLR